MELAHPAPTSGKRPALAQRGEVPVHAQQDLHPVSCGGSAGASTGAPDGRIGRLKSGT